MAKSPINVTAGVGTSCLAYTDSGGTDHMFVKVLADTSGNVVNVTSNALNVDVKALPNEGQQTMANSISVAIASDQDSLTVDAPVGTPVNVQVGDGTNTATIRNLSANDALNVAIVDASGNQITSFGGSGGTSHQDDAAFSIGSASSITPTGYLADETTPDSVDEGDVGVPRMTLSRKPYAVITDATSENNAAVDGSGHLQVDIAADSVGIGGGTQYGEGTTQASITGTAILWEDTSDVVRAVSATNPLPNNTVEIGGTAISANTGTVDGGTQRVTLASNDAAVTSLAAIDNIVHAPGDSRTSASLVGGEMDDATTVLATEGTVHPARITEYRALHTTLHTSGGTEFTVGTGARDAGTQRVTIATDDSVPVTNADLTAIAAAIGAGGDSLPASTIVVSGSDGANARALATDASGNLQVDVLTFPDNEPVDLGQVGGNTVDTGTGTAGTGTQRVAVASDSSIGVTLGNTISTNNTTSTPLGISGVFTGTGDDVSAYAAVTCTLYADVASATDGMKFQFSTDNTNWDDVYTFTLSAGTTRRFQFPVTAQYFRIVYTNGGTGQSAFRVQTLFISSNVMTSVHRLVDDMSPDRSANVVKAALFAQASGSGDFVPVDSNASGKLQVAAETELNGAVFVDDAAYTLGTDSGVMMMGFAGTQSVDANDAAALACDTDGALHISDGGNSLTVDNTALTSLGNSLGADNDTFPSLVQAVGGTDGTNLQAISVDTSGNVQCDVVASLPAGTNAIGKLAANSGVDIGDVDVTSQPARVRTTDNIGVADLFGVLMSGTTELTLSRATVNATASGNTAVVAAGGAGVARKVVWAHLINNGASVITVKFQSATTDIWHSVDLAADGGGGTLPYNPSGWMVTADNEALNINLSATGTVGCTVGYVSE